MPPPLSPSESLADLFGRQAFPPDAFRLPSAFQGRKLIVYGAGESYHYYQEVVDKKHGFKAHAILDRKFQSIGTFDNIPAYPPEVYQPHPEELTSAIVVICLSPVSPHLPDVQSRLQAMGFQNIVPLLDIYEIHNPFNEPESLKNQGFPFYKHHETAIHKAFKLLEDELSREVYLHSMKTHMTRRPVPIPMSPRLEQYRPTDVPLKKGYARSIHGGMSAGDIPWLFRAKGPLESLVIIEPHAGQYAEILHHIEESPHCVAGQLTLLPLALHDTEITLPFLASNSSFGARIHPEGKQTVQCASLDHLLPGTKVDFLGLDIEGAELQALQGAKKLLTHGKPDLGICVYHSPEQLWEIPLFLHELVPEYRFFLRNYTGFTGETVLYATTT